MRGIFTGDEEEAAGAAGGVDDGVANSRLDEGTRSEVLTGAGTLVGGALAEQFLDGIQSWFSLAAPPGDRYGESRDAAAPERV